MNYPIYHVRTVEIVEPYTLCVRFTDDTEQIIYLKPVLAGELYDPLLDLDDSRGAAIHEAMRMRVCTGKVLEGRRSRLLRKFRISKPMIDPSAAIE